MPAPPTWRRWRSPTSRSTAISWSSRSCSRSSAGRATSGCVRVGFEARCAVREGTPEPAPDRPRRHRAARGRRGVRRRDRGLGCGRRDRRGDPGGRRTGRPRSRVRPLRRPGELSDRSARRSSAPLPRRGNDDRDREARDPRARRPHGRRDHRDQLRDLLPRPARGARRLGEPRGHRLGNELEPLYEAAEVLAVTPLDPEESGGTASSVWRAHGPSARAAGRSAETRALACSAAPAHSAAGWTPSAPRMSPTCRAR